MDDVRRDQEEEIVEDAEGTVAEASKEVNEEFEALKSLATQLENNYKRALADYQNLQRRTQEEKSEWIRMANREMVLKMLPVLDTLMLAAKHLQDKGLDLSVNQFFRILEDEGVTKIEVLGKTFDPHTMEAVTTQESDTDNKGKVIEEVRTGFVFGDNVLRAAQVIVGA